MKKSNIKEIIRSFIYETAQITNDKITDDSLIFKDGFFDSMGFIVMISFIEEKFKISINDENLTEENFESINRISEFVLKKIDSSIEIQ